MATNHPCLSFVVIPHALPCSFDSFCSLKSSDEKSNWDRDQNCTFHVILESTQKVMKAYKSYQIKVSNRMLWPLTMHLFVFTRVWQFNNFQVTKKRSKAYFESLFKSDSPTCFEKFETEFRDYIFTLKIITSTTNKKYRFMSTFPSSSSRG